MHIVLTSFFPICISNPGCCFGFRVVHTKLLVTFCDRKGHFLFRDFSMTKQPQMMDTICMDYQWLISQLYSHLNFSQYQLRSWYCIFTVYPSCPTFVISRLGNIVKDPLDILKYYSLKANFVFLWCLIKADNNDAAKLQARNNVSRKIRGS